MFFGVIDILIGGCVVFYGLGQFAEPNGRPVANIVSGIACLLTGFGLVFISQMVERLTRIEKHLGLETPLDETANDEFRKIENPEGSAICLGCRKVVLKSKLLYNQAYDLYCHLDCMPQDEKVNLE